MRRVIFLLTITAMCWGQAPRTPRPKPPETGWMFLFNGKDLTNWVKVGNENWTVEEGGVLHGKGVTDKYGYLRTEKAYKDFDLSMQYKCEGPGNSGVFFHCDFKPGTVDVSQGVQFEIDQKQHSGGLYGDGRGWIAWPAPELEGVQRPHDWNDYLMTVHGNHFTARLNGVLILDYTDPAPRSFDGFIALQLHAGGNGDMKFKEIQIRDLTKR